MEELIYPPLPACGRQGGGGWIEFCNLYFCLPLEGVPVGGGWIGLKI
jgi:hypothetical protein